MEEQTCPAVKESPPPDRTGACVLKLAGGLFLLAMMPVIWVGHGCYRVALTENLVFDAGDANVVAVRQGIARGADVNGRFESGKTPLEMAILNRENDLSRRLETVRVLLDAGADPNLPISSGDPPLLIAVESEMIRLLKSRGAVYKRRLLNF